MAKGYKFSLQKVLELREEKEEESKRLFSQSQNNKIKAENELDSLREQYENYKGIKPGEDVVYQKVKRRYLFALQGGIKEKEKELAARERELEVRRRDLKNKQIDRKTVETLRDKQYASFVKAQEMKEQNDLDEFALYAYMRTLKGGE